MLNFNAKAKLGRFFELAYDSDQGLAKRLVAEKGKYSLRLNEDGTGILRTGAGVYSFDAAAEMKSIGITSGTFAGTVGVGRNGDIDMNFSLGKGAARVGFGATVNVVDAIMSCSGLLCNAARHGGQNRMNFIDQASGW